MLDPRTEGNVRVVAQSSRTDVWDKHSQKENHTCIGIEDDKNIHSYVYFHYFVM